MTAAVNQALNRHLRLHSFPRLLAASIIFSSVLLLGSAAILWRSWSANAEAERDVTRSYATLLALKDVHRAIVAVNEVGERGLIFGHNDAPTEPYVVRRDRLRDGMAELQRLVGDDPGEQQHIRALDELVEQRLAGIDRVLQLEQAGQREAAVAAMQGIVRTADLLPMRARIQDLEDREVQHLAALQNRLAVVGRREVHLALGLLAAEAFFVGFTVLLARRVLALRRMVTVCAWSKQIKVDGRWVPLEQYLGEELNLHLTHGISPTMAEKLLADLDPRSEPSLRTPIHAA